jgi:hypothetical protein
MRHAVMLALLLPSLALAQVPAPVGGDMSNTTTKATGSTTPRKLADRAADAINPKDFGAIGDGQSHPVACPDATPATQEADWCAMQAAINWIATRSAVPNVVGTPGGTIRIPAGTTLKLGTTPLTANNIGLAIVGEDQWSSAILIGATPMLNFGLSNGMGIGVANVGSTGAAFVPGELLTLTGAGGTCSDLPQITVLTTGTAGDIQTSQVSHGGNCSVTPSTPLQYTTSGIGYGATFNGGFSAGALFTTGLLTTTGTGCVNGEVLTGTGGSTPGGTPTQFQLTVTNAVAGVIQAGGFTISNPGSYGTPPPNPVNTTGSGSCTGAAFNVSRFTNSGGALTLQKLQLIADAPGASIVKAQFNLIAHTTLFEDLIITAVNSGTGYFNGGFDLSSASVASFSRIDARNNLTYLNSNPSNALFIMRSQNNLLGHYDYNFDKVSVAYYMGGGFQFTMNAADTVGFQSIQFHHVICGLGAHCIRLDNTSPRGYGKIEIDDLYAGQTIQQIEIKSGINVTIVNSSFNSGVTRVTSPPAQADFVTLDSVNQWLIRGNICGTSTIVTPSVTCFHIKGTSSFGIASNNIISNAAKAPTIIGYVFDSGTTKNLQTTDNFVAPAAGLTPVQDAGTGNITHSVTGP